MKHHLDQVLRVESREFPWRHMIISAAATGLPLFAGLLWGHALMGILGALCGYLLCLNDHFGSLAHRTQVISVTFLFMVAGFTLGNAFHEWEWTFRLIFTLLVYWIGLFGGEGAELEKGMLFCTLTILVAHSLPPLADDLKFPLFMSGVLGYGSLLIAALLLYRWAPHTPRPHASLRWSFKKSLTTNLARHLYAANYALTSLLSIWLCEYYKVERGYWVTITLLLIMRPDRQQSIYKIIQRLAGTALGVALFTPIARSFSTVTPFVFLAILAAAAIPWSVRRNYLLVSGFVTILLFSLLEIVAVDHSDLHITIVRFYATLLGCGLALVGVAFSKLCEQLIKT